MRRKVWHWTRSVLKRWARLRAAVRGSGQLTEAERQREDESACSWYDTFAFFSPCVTRKRKLAALYQTRSLPQLEMGDILLQGIYLHPLVFVELWGSYRKNTWTTSTSGRCSYMHSTNIYWVLPTKPDTVQSPEDKAVKTRDLSFKSLQS